MSNINFTRESLRNIREEGVPDGRKQLETADTKTAGLSVVQYPSGNQVFYFSLTYRKRRYRIRLGDSDTLNITEVRAIAVDMRSAIQKGENPDGRRKKAELLFKDLVYSYQLATKSKKRSWTTDDSKFRHHLLPYFGNSQLGSIEKSDIEKYHTKKENALSPATANRHLALLKAVFTYAVKELGVIQQSPAQGISNFPEPQVKRKYFTIGELQLLLTALEQEGNIEAKQILKFILLTGCRRSTARQVKLEDYDPHLGTILAEMTKSGEGQFLALSDAAKTIIEGQIAKYGRKGLVFRGIDMVSPISCPSAVLKRVCRRAGLPERGTHCLRHSYSLLLLENGASQYQLQQALNHKCSASTSVYSAISGEKLSQINNNLATLLNL